MNKKKAFSLAEALIVIVVIGFITYFGVPIIVNTAREKIENTQYYEAYHSMYEGAKRAKAASPFHQFNVLRSGSLGVSSCDVFMDVFSVTDREDVPPNGVCPFNSTIGTNGFCNVYTFVEDDVDCPISADLISHEFCDSSGNTACLDANGHAVLPDGGKYCQVVPTYTMRYESCNDESLDAAGNPHAVNYVTETPVSDYSDNTQFDSPVFRGNFTTANGLTFYGLEKYPLEAGCDGAQLLDFTQREKTCNHYKNVYIDVDGKNTESPKMNDCPPCNHIPNDANAEYGQCKNTLKCLKEKFGIYKFRLYNDGRVEPMTNRDVEKGKLMFQLVYVANGKVVEVQPMFTTYQEARDYKIPTGGALLRYWNSKLDSRGNALGWTEENITQPCHDDFNFKTFECTIIPNIPEVSVKHATPAGGGAN